MIHYLKTHTTLTEILIQIKHQCRVAHTLMQLQLQEALTSYG